MSEAEPAAAGSTLAVEPAETETNAQAVAACGYCAESLTGQYWVLSKRPACESCRGVVQRELAASRTQRHFLRAAAYGLGAGLVGSAVWALIEKLFQVQVGLVAVGIGYAVGRAVRKGAFGFGGRRYQVLAVSLTYASIALASLPAVLESSSSIASLPSLIRRSFVAPFLGGTEDVLGWLIIAVGLYQAWKLTRAIPIQVLGPFSLASPRSSNDNSLG